MRIAITGATGLLGRNLLFEILKNNLRNLDNLQIFILGRSHEGCSLNQRLSDIILNDGLEYIASSKASHNQLLSAITAIPFDLTLNNLGISGNDNHRDGQFIHHDPRSTR